GADDVLLLGTDDLCDRYGRALSRAGVASARGATGTTPRALAHLARRAGLLGDGSGTAGPDDADRAPAAP
ncbi:hypothetical protein Q7689_24475, partial [Nocardiopsis tropica]|nr:hypothetical protein [Nocardiopsis tropica]